MPRVYVAPSFLEPGLRGEEFDLDADTSKKLTRVLRLSAGEIFVAFDGVGGEWECALTDAGEGKGKSARAAIISERLPAQGGRLHLSIAQAVPKGDKMEFVLQKGTELGAMEFWPFSAGRSIPLLEDDERILARAQRWRRIVEAASAQCGRADVPIVHALGEYSTCVDYGTGNGSRCFALDESSAPGTLREALKRDPLQWNEESDGSITPARVMLLVGPEGGWTTREREWAERYGAESVGLGRLVLRTETAALVAAAILQWEVGELG